MMLLYYLLFHKNFSIDFFSSNCYADNLIYGNLKNTYYYYYYCYYHHFIGFFSRFFPSNHYVDNMIWNRKTVMEKSPKNKQ